MKEKWLFLDSGYCSPAYNMALDEALLNWHSNHLIPPAIRFYGWKPAGLSLGYFQKTKNKINVDAVEKHGYGLVRRLTGGRAVLHDDELTYSIVVSEQHPNMPQSVTEAYRIISEGLLRGFQSLGVHAEFAVPENGSGRHAANGSAVCFEEPSWYELIVEGRKAAGSAQTRQKGVLLQHGSIPINVDEEKLFNLFVYPSERAKERALRSFGSKAAAISQLRNKKTTMDEVKHAFKTGFEKGLNIELQSYTLNEEQLEEVKGIAQSRYENDDWTFSR
jgi:lipoate-protein ligase A